MAGVGKYYYFAANCEPPRDGSIGADIFYWLEQEGGHPMRDIMQALAGRTQPIHIRQRVYQLANAGYLIRRAIAQPVYFANEESEPPRAGSTAAHIWQWLLDEGGHPMGAIVAALSGAIPAPNVQQLVYYLVRAGYAERRVL